MVSSIKYQAVGNISVIWSFHFGTQTIIKSFNAMQNLYLVNLITELVISGWLSYCATFKGIVEHLPNFQEYVSYFGIRKLVVIDDNICCPIYWQNPHGKENRIVFRWLFLAVYGRCISWMGLFKAFLYRYCYFRAFRTFITG